MKQILLITLTLVTSTVMAQVPWATYGEWVENSEFECWENENDPKMEPCNWSSLKTATPSQLANAAPDGSVSRDAGRNGGYCMKLLAQAYNIGPTTIVANGLATTGRVYASFDPEEGYVFTDTTDEQWYMPQHHSPDSLMGYYKFSPQGGDKGKVEAIIHTEVDSDGNSGNGIAQLPAAGTSTSNVLARARMDFTASQSSWKRFSAPFNYYNTTPMPRYMLIICSAGDSTQAVDQTTLWIDDLEEVYNTLSIEENDNEFLDFTLINGNEIKVDVRNSDHYSIEVFNTAGKMVFNKVNTSGNQIILPNRVSNGFFIVKLSTQKSFHTKKYFIK